MGFSFSMGSVVIFMQMEEKKSNFWVGFVLDFNQKVYMLFHMRFIVFFLKPILITWNEFFFASFVSEPIHNMSSLIKKREEKVFSALHCMLFSGTSWTSRMPFLIPITNFRPLNITYLLRKNFWKLHLRFEEKETFFTVKLV